MDLNEGEIAYETLKSIEPYVLLAENHPLVAQNKVSITALNNEPYVLFDWPGSREHFLAILKNAGIKPRITFKSQSYELVRGAVENGMGLSLLLLYTRSKTDMTYDGKSIACRPIKETVPALDIVAAWPANAGPSPLREAFLNLSHEFFAASTD